MRRRLIHGAFAALTFGAAISAAYQGMELRHAVLLSRAVSDASRPGRPRGAAVPLPPFPEARLAAANALSAAGIVDDAARLYTGLMHEQRHAEVARAASFNFANLYLRQGEAAMAGGDTARGLPIVDLAKQRYRDLLRDTPDDWDARYNLERALRLAPEESSFDGEPQKPVGQQRLKTDKLPPVELP